MTRPPHPRLSGLIGFLAGLLALSAPALADPEAALRQAAALIWDMGDLYWDFGNRHIARGMTPERVESLAVKTADKLVTRRDDLAALLPHLDSRSRFAEDLGRFLARWPDRQAYRDDLLRFYKGEELGLAISGLKGQVADPRGRWKTPFPFFRP